MALGNRVRFGVGSSPTVASPPFKVRSPLIYSSPALLRAASGQPLRTGAKGEGVARLQIILLLLGHELPEATRETGAVDGVFTQETEQRVRAVQREESLTVDGVVEAKTLAALDKRLLATSATLDDNAVISVSASDSANPALAGLVLTTRYDDNRRIGTCRDSQVEEIKKARVDVLVLDPLSNHFSALLRSQSDSEQVAWLNDLHAKAQAARSA